MNTINNFIIEKLKINSKSKIGNDKDEEFYEKTSTDLYNEVQNEIDKDGEYHTYSIENGKKKFKKGFISFSIPGEYFVIQGFNKAEDYADCLGVDSDSYDEYDKLDVGESTTIDSGDGPEEVIRIW